MTKKQCTKCKRMLDSSEFSKNKNSKDGLQFYCKECVSRYQKEKQVSLKLEIMTFFGGRCVHIDKNGVQCSKNIKDDLEDLTLSHPNNDGNEHRNLISHGYMGYHFYRALKKLGYDTGKFVVVVMCETHHSSLDNSGKRYYNKKGDFNNPAWLIKKYETMTLKEIAILCGVSEGTIRNRTIKFNIARRKPWQRP